MFLTNCSQNFATFSLSPSGDCYCWVKYLDKEEKVLTAVKCSSHSFITSLGLSCALAFYSLSLSLIISLISLGLSCELAFYTNWRLTHPSVHWPGSSNYDEVLGQGDGEGGEGGSWWPGGEGGEEVKEGGEEVKGGAEEGGGIVLTPQWTVCLCLEQ